MGGSFSLRYSLGLYRSSPLRLRSQRPGWHTRPRQAGLRPFHCPTAHAGPVGVCTGANNVLHWATIPRAICTFNPTELHQADGEVDSPVLMPEAATRQHLEAQMPNAL